MQNFRSFILKNIFILMLMLVMGSCIGTSSSSSDDSDDSNTDAGGTPSGGITDEDGTELTSVETSDPVYLSLTGLTPNTQYNIEVEGPDGDLSPEGGFIATTDEDGAVPTSTLIQDLSTTAAGANLILWGTKPTPRLKAVTGTYTIRITDADGVEVHTDTFTVVDDDKIFCSDSSAVGRASFTSSESVYARIEKGDDGELTDGTYTCYTFSDLGTAMADGDTLSGTTTSVTVSSGVGLASMGTFASGQYDVICDLNANGLYDEASDLVARPGRFRPCFTIQSVNSGNDIIGQVCADRHGNYRDVFDPDATDSDIRDVWAWISPSERSLVQHATGVRKYVVTHQSTWSDGDALTDVTGASSSAAFELDAVQAFCTNESPWLIWPRERLTAGCYDCVIDVNANGIYDTGTDFVDNIDNNADNTTCGMRVASTACSDTAITVTSHTDAQTVTTTAITLTGTFAETPARATVTIASAAQSNTVAISGATTDFSVAIPLFSGENLLTITTVDASGVACSKTITLTSTSATAANDLFRAQLIWDGSTDMDLHLVKPSGDYANGGYGTSDCNYGNCKVGLDGSSTNSIDWGDSGEADDPKLDVDCVSCGNGIENIWVNEIPEDGDYDVYVDAYSGSETAVSVKIFIRSSTVATVSCGAMEAGSSTTDSCFVGTISWTGGDNGNGTFTAVGTKASDY
ncbi:MAG: hypothetical protein HQM16_09145 [Deltaproteobacteria bacterium]|nr:hypothetical protein [Deltaproteobacteria bacterium]